MKKSIAILCSIVLCASTVTPAFAETADFAATEVQVIAEQNVPVSYATEDSFTNVTDAAKFLREKMTERASDVSLNYRIKIKDAGDLRLLSEKIFDEAIKHTGKSNEGDALKWAYENWDCKIEGAGDGTYYYLVFKYHINFYATANQEKAVVEEIARIKKELNVDNVSDYEQLKAIYQYLAKNVTYDYENLNNSSYMLKYTDYATLIKKTSVCQGYALALYRLALEYGIDTRFVAGTSRGEEHAWNMVKMGDKYYYVDVTWDSNYTSHRYFLKGSKNFSEDHTPDGESTPAELGNGYVVDTNDYVVPSAPEDNGGEQTEQHTHKYEKVITPATTKKSGKIEEKCQCGVLKSKTTVSKIGTVKLSKTSYTYNGKKQTVPKIVVTNSKGKTISSKYYTVTKPKKSLKAVGTYTYTVKFKGNYSGTKKLTLTIKPKSTTLKKVKTKKNSFTVKVGKLPSGINGYELKLATDSKFTKNAKSLTLPSTQPAEIEIYKVSSKKTHYVKVRTYKTVGGKNIYSSWSKAVKIEKK